MPKEKRFNLLREEFQKMVEESIWEGEDKWTKNFALGNISEWWIMKIDEIIKENQLKVKKIIDYSLIPKDVDLSKIKKLQIACGFCKKIATMTISEDMEMTQELMDHMEKELKGWQRSHCKHHHA